MRGDFASLISGTKHLASYVKLSPNCSTLETEYALHLKEIQRWDARIALLEIHPSYVLKFRYPDIGRPEDIGTDSLLESNAVSKEEIRIDGIWFSLPGVHVINGSAMAGAYASFSIWLPAESYDQDLGACGMFNVVRSYHK